MIYGSAFSGVGGFDLACHRAGMDAAFMIELDPYRASVLKRHFPEVPLHDDVFQCGRTTGESLRLVQPSGDRTGVDDPEGGERLRDAGSGARSGRVLPGVSRGDADDRPVWERGEERGVRRWVERTRPVVYELPEVDLLTGGFPCRDLSISGSRRGLDAEGTEDGSQLFFELARLGDELVRPGGWILVENVPGLLSSAGGRDFAVVLRTLGDLGFHDLAWRVLDSRGLGVPQRRRRVFILARRATGRRARDVLLEPEVGGGDPATLLSAGQDAARATRGGAEADISILGGGVAHTLRGEGFDASEDGTGRGTPLIYVEPVAISENIRGEVREHPYSTSVQGGGGKVGQGYQAARIGSAVRRLTPTECERLQGFPDGWSVPVGPSLADAPSWYQLPADQIPRRAEEPKPHGPRYEACGRAVSVPVIEWIVGRILADART